MPTQRVRAGRTTTPQRNNIRSRLAEFDETDNQFVSPSPLSAPATGGAWLGKLNDEGILVLQPNPLIASRVEQDSKGIRAYDTNEQVILNVDAEHGTILAKGQITGGSLKLDDTAANSTYWYMADDVGITSRISATDTQMSKLVSIYAAPGGNVYQRQWLLSVHDIGSPYGTDNGRSAFVQVFNTKDTDNQSADTTDNRSMVLLRAKVSTSATEVTAFVEATNHGTNFQVQSADTINLLPTTGGVLKVTEKFQVAGDPLHVASPLAVSNYAAGCHSWYAQSTSNSSAISSATVLLSLNNIPVIAGRRYECVFYSRTLNISAANDTIEARVQRDPGGGFGTIGDGVWQAGAAGENFGGCYVVADYVPTSTQDVDFQVEAERTSGSGTGHVFGGTSTSPMYLRVTDIGW